MRTLLLVWTLTVGGAPPAEHRDGDRWLGADKAEHWLASAAIYAAGYAMLRGVQASRQQSLMGAGAGTMLAGLTKETIDRRAGGEFCLKDLTWDAIGGLSAAAVLRRGP